VRFLLLQIFLSVGMEAAILDIAQGTISQFITTIVKIETIEP
jgi:hypothetical protein